MNLLHLRRSLRVRLLAGTLFWIAATILLAGWVLGSLFRQHVEDQFHSELAMHLDQLTAQLTLDEQGKPQLALPLSDPRLTRPFSGYYWQIDRVADAKQNSAGLVGQLRSRSLWDHVLAVPDQTPAGGDVAYGRVVGPQDQMLVTVQRQVRLDELPNQAAITFRLTAAANENFMLEPVAHFSGILWLALGVLAVGLVLAAVVQVVSGLAPLRRLREALGAVRNAQAQQLEGQFPVEIMPLIDDFNKVLTQNAEVVERARTHAGNLAHALKTPLSVLANAAHDDALDRAALAHLVGDQVGIARQQVNYHLARAQAAATSRMPGARTELKPVLDGLFRVMSRIHTERHIALEQEPFAAALSFRGEAQDLQEMLGNVLDNACKWAATRVRVSVRCQDAMLTLTIDDDGPGLLPEQREAVLQRGVRADEQTPGSGLGLAIVDDLARLYGGHITLTDSPLQGLRVALVLPAV
ncbi:MAG: two-component sensor histidine kinase [Comamonadaceae bacterium]|nr:MAG: two-component sensor histidine kinase [Comamonadaceae bacterium]